jgi:hypothetical protein
LTPQTKARIEELQVKRASLAIYITDIQKQIAIARSAMEDQTRRLQIEIQEADAEMQKLQAKINEEESAAYVAEFHKLAAELDKEGESPERLARWKHLHCQLRTSKRLGQSFALCDNTTSRLRGLPGYMPLPAELRTWAAVAKNWVRA